MKQIKKVWASNQTPPKFIFNPTVMIPQLVSEDEARYNMYVICESRQKGLYKLEKDTENLIFSDIVGSMYEEFYYSNGFKEKFKKILNILLTVVIAFPILKLTQFRIKSMLNKTKKTNPEWWI